MHLTQNKRMLGAFAAVAALVALSAPVCHAETGANAPTMVYELAAR